MKIKKSNKIARHTLNYIKLARLNQVTGIWLLFLPCLFGVALAAKKLPLLNFETLSPIVFLFLIGSIVMRSAGCVINDLFDRNLDKEVTRTKNRPLADGTISVPQAIIFLSLLLLSGLIILLQFNLNTILSGFAILGLVIIYPLTKRITYYPQLFLGITFNMGILMASLAVFERVTSESIVLYLACIIWTVIYDTIYAYQDIESDLKVGIKSAAIKFRKTPKKILLSLLFIMLALLFLLGVMMAFKIDYFLIITLFSVIYAIKIKSCDFSNPPACLCLFKNNILLGALILIAIIAG